MNFESFDSQYDEVEISYKDEKIVLVDKEHKFCPLEAEMIMQEYLDSLDKNVEVGGAFMYVDGYWGAQVFDAE